MSEPLVDNSDLPKEDLLTSLKAKADLLGISYHPSIGVEKLKEKIDSKLADTNVADGQAASQEASDPGSVDPDAEVVYGVETVSQKRARLQREASALVRVRLQCLDPAKKEWEGEIFTVGNSVVGTHRKYIPYNAEDGWHIPAIILQELESRLCQVFKTVKGPRGEKVRQGHLVKAYAIERLPALTEAELHDLAQRQAMSKSVG